MITNKVLPEKKEGIAGTAYTRNWRQRGITQNQNQYRQQEQRPNATLTHAAALHLIFPLLQPPQGLFQHEDRVLHV